MCMVFVSADFVRFYILVSIMFLFFRSLEAERAGGGRGKVGERSGRGRGEVGERSWGVFSHLFLMFPI